MTNNIIQKKIACLRFYDKFAVGACVIKDDCLRNIIRVQLEIISINVQASMIFGQSKMYLDYLWLALD